jgi:hypothetical protein
LLSAHFSDLSSTRDSPRASIGQVTGRLTINCSTRSAKLRFATTRQYFGTGVILAAFAIASIASSTDARSQTTEPLIQRSNITYLGAFAMGYGTGTSTLDYGGSGLTVYNDPAVGKTTLYLEGNAQRDGQVAQILPPSTLLKSLNYADLPTGTFLQNFHDVFDGKQATCCSGGIPGNGAPVFGMLPYNGRLIVAIAEGYGTDQIDTHGASGFNLSVTNDFQGFYPINAVANQRAIGGYMTLIPTEWQSLLGGPALTGNCCLSIISATSAGPSATVFNPNDVGVKNPIPGTTVVFYPITNALCGPANCESTQNSVFNLTTRVKGIAFPPGSRSILFFGTQGIGPYCYGTQTDCNDPYTDGKGPHAPPYVDLIWAYDANDFVSVKNGVKQPWQISPYAIWQFGTEMYSGSEAEYITGAGYDPASGRLYIAQYYGPSPRIDVYQITPSGSGTVVRTPNPPVSLSVK